MTKKVVLIIYIVVSIFIFGIISVPLATRHISTQIDPNNAFYGTSMMRLFPFDIWGNLFFISSCIGVLNGLLFSYLTNLLKLSEFGLRIATKFAIFSAIFTLIAWTFFNILQPSFVPNIYFIGFAKVGSGLTIACLAISVYLWLVALIVEKRILNLNLWKLSLALIVIMAIFATYTKVSLNNRQEESKTQSKQIIERLQKMRPPSSTENNVNPSNLEIN